MPTSRALALTGLAASLPALLPRMRADVEADGALRRSTATAMWGVYALATGLYADALRNGTRARPATRAAAAAAAAAGLGLTAAAMGTFRSASQITGTSAGTLETDGIYRLSRNPQYLGFVLAGAAGAVARRSPLALALTAAYAGICRWWIPVEERALQREFGEAYDAYRARTGRWLTLP